MFYPPSPLPAQGRLDHSRGGFSVALTLGIPNLRADEAIPPTDRDPTRQSASGAFRPPSSETVGPRNELQLLSYRAGPHCAPSCATRSSTMRAIGPKAETAAMRSPVSSKTGAAMQREPMACFNREG